MFCPPGRTVTKAANGLLAAALALSFVAWAPAVDAQGSCQEWTDVLLDTTSSCISSPIRDRAFDLETYRFNGGEFLMMSRGNELQIFDIGPDPAHPISGDTSSFRFGTAGDSDYDVMSFDVCDDCRYGVMDHKVAGVVVFDLGTGSQPRFTTYSRQGTLSAGSVVFKVGTQHYLVTAGLASGCSRSALYAVNGASSLSLLQCVEADSSALKVVGGEAYHADAGTFLFLGGGLSADAHLFETSGIGSGLRIQYLTSPPGMKGFHRALAIDPHYRLLASADIRDRVVRFWDLTSPASPARIDSWELPVTAGYVSLRSANSSAPLVLASHGDGWLNSARTFLVDPVGGPEPMDNAFWTDLTEPHNAFQTCVQDQGSALAPDGSAFYLARYATTQVFDLSQCMGPTQAAAEVTVSPATVFPGGAVTIRDATTGSYDRWALWVERNGVLYAGSQTPSAAGDHVLAFNVPSAGLSASDVFTGHIKVESDDLAPIQAEDAVPIGIDRAPQASFTISPEAAIVGDTVTLSASAEGFPAADNPYTWVISKPSSATSFPTGQSVPVTLDMAGEWTFELTVSYEHDDPGGEGSYQDVVTEAFTVASVAADFTVSPASPLSTQAITLDGSSSKGAIASYLWTVHGPTDRSGDGIEPSDYTSCPAEPVCTIPADTLEWGAYAVTLTVTGTDDAVDPSQRTVTVANGAIQPSFSFIPSSPEIGESVVFTIEGVLGDVEQATWTMGGTGCDGASATQVCTPSQFNNCKALAFKYLSGGTKTVGLTVRVNGIDYADLRPAAERTVTVAFAGSCDGGGSTCTYTFSDGGATFGPDGGDRAFTVFTSSGCSWTASEGLSWVRITSGASGTGSGTVRYTVDANAGPQRSGAILAGGRLYSIVQQAPDLPVAFEMSKVYPLIGETVTFTADAALEVGSWDFGEPDCRGNSPVINCSFLPPGACNEMEWTFPTAGEKSVTMKLSDGREKSKHPTVQNNGECCTADRAPTASFVASSAEPAVGEQVLFTDTSAKALGAKALGFSWTPTSPAIGENTVFTLSGVTGDVAKATWSMGGTGCGGASATQVCTPGLFNDCKATSFKYASAGDKPVSVELELVGGGTQSAGPVTLTVANTGSCDGGGGTCSYSLSPISADFPPAGGAGSFNVTTSAGCAWAASTSASWLTIDGGSGSGPGTVSYTVDGYAGSIDRSGYINVEGRTHTVRQQAPAADLDTAPTSWLWTVTRLLDGGGVEEVAAHAERHFSYAFAEPGAYRVSLVASNCAGASEYSQLLTVTESLVEAFVVGAAVKVSGANDTRWETDLRFHNPCGEPLDVRIEYQPEGQNNSESSNLVFREFQLDPDQTRVFSDITEAIPVLVDEELSGSVRIVSSSASGCKVLSVSRTYNSTPDGTLGLFVPALPVKRADREFLNLTGLVRDADYRSNLRLVNYGDEDVWVPLFAYDRLGEPISTKREAQVLGHSTRQINDIAGWLGVTGDLGPFSVRAEVSGLQVEAIGTVVDNLTGDSVLFRSSFSGDNRVWVAGVASTAGVNDSQWRTDLWIHNPTEDWLAGELDFVVGTSPDEVYGFVWPDLKPHRVRDYLDLVGQELKLEETSGYLVLVGADGGPAPQVAARTYNLDLAGGTYGLGLPSFTEDELLRPGETGYIVGISNSADQSVGFRTNLGLLNTDRERWTGVRLTLIELSGAVVGEPLELVIAPGVLRQFDVAKQFGVSDVTGTASLMIEVTEGGGLAAYATEIDNRTQDSIFIPALRPFMGMPQ